MYYKRNNTCAYCGNNSRYELCIDCYNLSKEDFIIKDENGNWIENIKKGIEHKFYDPNKNYYIREPLLNEFEMRFFNILRETISKKYTITPQINLQSIIETDSNKRNDELYRNIDFGLFYTKNYKPFLMIELNGKQHYTNSYWIERDKSVAQILEKCELPLLTLTISNIKNMSNYEIAKLMNKVIKYLNPNFITRIFKKNQDKLDLTWTKEYLK